MIANVPTPTLIIGFSTRAIADSALRAGYPIVTVDAFEETDRANPAESYFPRGVPLDAIGPEQLVDLAQNLDFESVVYAGGMEHDPDLLERFCQGKVLLGNSPQTLREVRSPHTLFRFLKQNGYHFPETLPGDSPEKPFNDGRWLVKNRSGAAGWAVRQWDGTWPLPHGDYLQRQLSGQVCSFSFVADGKRAEVIGLSEQLVGLPAFGGRDFFWCGNLLPLTFPEPETDLPTALLPELRRLANDLAREFHLFGLNGVDFILVAGKPFILEVNPRYSASMELIDSALNANVFDWHIQACRGTLPPPIPDRQLTERGRVWGAAILYAWQDLILPDTGTWRAEGFRNIPLPFAHIAKEELICTILADGSSGQDCLNRLIARTENLKSQINS